MIIDIPLPMAINIGLGVLIFIFAMLYILKIVSYKKNKKHLSGMEKELSDIRMEFIKIDALIDEKTRRIEYLENIIKEINVENDILVRENTKIKSDYDNQKKYMDEKFADIERNKEELALKFKNISSEIIQKQREQFDNEQKKSLEVILNPFKEQLVSFKEKVEVVHKDSIKQQGTLDEQLRSLFNLNQSLSKDAQDLTDALKGNKKLQGNWGEFQLERILEVSGLSKGIAYKTQESYKSEENNTLIPDVIVQLPNNRSVIIDSKVSLVDYISYINAENEEERKNNLKKHVRCIKDHIERLSSKEYQKLLKDASLDYVVIFIPIESAYVDAINFDNDIYEYAHKKNVAITTPSSLLPILRTIENLWKIEKQNKNVQEIARVGGALHDKMYNFVEDMQKIEKAIDAARKNYDSAMGRLSDGKGSAISMAKRLKLLGAKTSKIISIETEDDFELLTEDVEIAEEDIG